MHLLTFIILFVIGAILAAMKGDFSGISMIGETLMFVGGFLFIAYIFTGFLTPGSGKLFLSAIVTIIIGFILMSAD